MSLAAEDKKRPNRVFQAMIALSLGVHVLIFLHIADLYHSESLRYIEVSLQEKEELKRRSIPRPRVKHEPPEVSKVEKINVSAQRVPRINPAPVEAEYPETAVEEVGMPDTAGLSAEVAEWESVGSPDYMQKSDYFDMLRLRIESNKQYPESARKRQIEGRVLVSFVIEQDGSVRDVSIEESSRHPILDEAAMKAVRESSPFPRPPKSFFSGPLPLKISLVFQLM